MEIGVDIVEIQRIKKLCNRKRFLSRFFVEDELSYINDKKLFYSHLAGKFAAKEAVAKALGTGFRYFKWHDIKVLNDAYGKPYVELSGKADEILKSRGFKKVLITISHSRDYAVAFAIAFGGAKD
jgi:holo-[acyl-carrier protein] synthase